MKIKRQGIVATLLALTLPLSGVASAAPAQADSNSVTQAASKDSQSLSDSEIQDLREDMRTRGISAENQDALIDKIRSGQLPDSDNPDVDPIDVSQSPTDENTQVLTFPDGSVAYTSIGKRNSDKVQARGVQSSECHRYWYNSGWERWDNCLVEYRGTAFIYGFRANLSLPHDSNGRGIIRNVYQPTVWRSWGHTVQSTNVRIIQGWEDKKANYPARAQMTATLQVAKIFSTKTLGLTLEVRGRKVSINPQM